MASGKTRFWTPGRSYDFQLFIKDRDYTPDLQRVSIATSITAPWQTIIFDFFIDANDMILDRIYGQDPIKLNIRLLGSNGIPIEQIELDLMYVDSNYDLIMKSTNPQKDMKDRSKVEVITVCRKPFQTMTTVVNSLYYDSDIQSVINNLVDKRISTGAALNYDGQGGNPEKIDQILIPPTTFHQAIRYLDHYFGVYNGLMGFFCLWDNTIYLKNLTKKPSTSHTFTIHQLTTDAKERDIVTAPADGKTFYTYKNVETSYMGNSIIAVTAPTAKFIVKPKDTLSHTIDIDMNSFATQYGIIAKNKKIFFDNEAIGSNRQRVYNEHTGYEKTESFINANLSKEIAEMSLIYISLNSKNVSLLNLMHVGESVKFNSKVSDYVQLTGKYILKSSELSFERLREWEVYADLNLIRTNKSLI
jgi:hypothetical protein